MSFSYDHHLTGPNANRNWVRRQLGDTVKARAVFQDEEIDAALADEGNKYLAAWRLGQAMLTSKTKGAVEKAVGDLRIRYSDSAEAAFSRHLHGLMRQGRVEQQKSTTHGPPAFTVL